MRNNDSGNNAYQISEMAIVDTFTKLIFSDQEGFSPQEELIIDAFRTVDANVLQDSYCEMGEYLRSLGVREMIHLVSRIREQILCDIDVAMKGSTEASLQKGDARRHTTH
jgi:hypothetical protein